jgi:hypothetical protein
MGRLCFLEPLGVPNGLVQLGEMPATVIWVSANALQVSHVC